MSRKILQIAFKLHISRAEFETAVAPLAEPIATVPGLLWKVWLINEAAQEAGGVYLFADGRSLESCLNGEMVASIVNHPFLSDFSVKQFDVVDRRFVNGPTKASSNTHNDDGPRYQSNGEIS